MSYHRKYSQTQKSPNEGGKKSVFCISFKSGIKKNSIMPFSHKHLVVYYIELEDYSQAEMWAKRAKQRDPQSSIVADTLGQVYKNHLVNEKVTDPREILQLAKKATEAFKHEEQLAEDELGEEMKDHHQAKVSRFYNSRGQFGYLQVCKCLYDKLVHLNITWGEILTKKVSMISVLESLGDEKLYRFNTLINTKRKVREITS